MSYQVLARKYRPRTFHELVGQEHVSKALIHALDQDRLHHAYLFTGTRGVGKTTIARILSRCLNCEQGVSSQPCGECDSCTEINEGRFVDLIEVDAASRTKVEDTRELLDNVQYTPTRGRYKVYLIDEVHMLSAHSFNALLKTLEEPPPHVKFLLATTDPQKLPVTVLSRCLQFNLKALSVERIAGHLQALLDKEMIRYEAPALQLLGQAARGSMRDALSLTDQAISFGGEQLDETSVRSMLGTVDREHVLRLLEALVSGDAETVLGALDEVAEQSPDELSLLDELIAMLHSIAICQAVPTRKADDVLTALAAKFQAEQVQLYYDIALRGRRDLGDAPDPRMGLDMLMLRMVLFRPDGVLPAGGANTAKKPVRPAPAPVAEPAPSLPSAAQTSAHAVANKSAVDRTPADNASASALSERVASMSSSAADHSSVEESPVAAKAAVSEPVAVRKAIEPMPVGGDLSQWWNTLVTSLSLDGMVRNLAHHAVLTQREGKHWTLTLDSGHQVIPNDERVETLQAMIAEALNETVQLRFISQQGNEGTPAQREEAARIKKLEYTRETISKDPIVRTLERDFGGRLDINSIEPD
jgi:DNA polymerase-3 subunit gamma/tau